MNKLIGYILAGVGLVGIGISAFPPIKDAIFSQIQNESVSKFLSSSSMILGIGLVVVGVIILYKGGSFGKKVVEVPIYSGKEVVGFRKIQK